MSPPLLRMLDANANRAREGLRVIEDYARFVLNDAGLQRELKEARHMLRLVLKQYLPDAILCRDTPGDVGTDTKMPLETRRADLSEVITAAGKRVGEALRTIEEILKTEPAYTSGSMTDFPRRIVGQLDYPAETPSKPSSISDSSPGARAIETGRYRFYEIEKRIALTLRPAKHFANVKLYVLITETVCSRPWLTAAEDAIAGGADCIQLREKDLDSGELLRRAKQLVALCKSKHVLCIINDRPDIALLSGADGVHVGQGDLPTREVRKLLGSQAIVGVSTHEIAHARQAVLDGADYVGVGPVFKSGTKPRDFIAGVDYARQGANEIPIPAVAIAGITLDNVDEVLATGVQAVAVTAAVVGAKDIATAARQFKQKFRPQMNTDAHR